jgi:hypothetical protein
MAIKDERQMDRRTFLGVAAGAAGGLLPTDVFSRAGNSKKPNILFVFSDQQRWDTADCYGAPIA